MKNDPTNWQRRLAGESVMTHVDDPEYGFFRVRSRDKLSWRPVAYWFDADGGLRCRLDGRDLDENRARELWPWAIKNPIAYEVYGAVTRGEPWPDLSEAVTRSNNAPPDNSIEALREAIDDLAREAQRLIAAGEAKTKDAADQAADVANRLSSLQKQADAARDVEKRPHLEAGRVVDDKWRPVITAADIYSRLKAVVCAPFLAAQKAAKERAEAEARRVASEAAEVARKAEQEAVRKAEEMAVTPSTANVDVAAEAIENAKWQADIAAEAKRQADAIANTRVTAGTRGRAVGLRSTIVVTIEDRPQVLAYFADRQEVTDLLQSMAEKAVKAGIVPPGVKVDKEDKAA